MHSKNHKKQVFCILPSYLLSLCLDLDRDLDLDGDLERDKDDLDLCLSRLLVYFCLPLDLCPLEEAEPVSWRLLWLPLCSSCRKMKQTIYKVLSIPKNSVKHVHSFGKSSYITKALWVSLDWQTVKVDTVPFMIYHN